MDDYSRRATIESVRERQREGNWGSEQAKSVLVRYEALVDMAQDIAKVVWSIRWPRSYEPSFEISFGEQFRDGRRAISASFYMHSSNDSFEFPFEYLFMTYDEIQTAEDIRADEAARERAEAAIARDNEQRRSEIAQLKRLREKYPEA